MNSPTFDTSEGDVAFSSTTRTMAEPTITPSASFPMAATCSGRPMPKPTQMGFVVTSRRARICSVTPLSSLARSPVTPVNETM